MAFEYYNIDSQYGKHGWVCFIPRYLFHRNKKDDFFCCCCCCYDGIELFPNKFWLNHGQMSTNLTCHLDVWYREDKLRFNVGDVANYPGHKMLSFTTFSYMPIITLIVIRWYNNVPASFGGSFGMKICHYRQVTWKKKSLENWALN